MANLIDDAHGNDFNHYYAIKERQISFTFGDITRRVAIYYAL